LDIYLMGGAPSLKNFIESRRTIGDRTGVFITLWHFGANAFHHALYALLSWDISGVVRSLTDSFRALVWAFRWHTLYSVVFFGVAFAVLSLAGGAICRIAALQLAQAERPGLKQALRFALRRFVSLLASPVGPIVLIFALGVPIILLGLVGNLPVAGELLTGLFLLPAFAVAFAIAIILIGTMAGLGLMLPAIAYEGSDSFDAINHSFSYVYTKPWRLGFYTIIAALYGALGYLFVRVFGFLVLWTTYRFLQIGFLSHNEKLRTIWPEPTFASFLGPAVALPDAPSRWVAALLIRMWVLVVIGLIVAFLISFYFSANTIIYALMRNRVDGTPLQEVYTSPDEPSAAPLSQETTSETTAPEPPTGTGDRPNRGPSTSE
jgi:hypothetical protein